MSNIKRRQPNPAQVSKTLSSAGIVKAGPYETFSQDPGFIVTRQQRRAAQGYALITTATVLHTGAHGNPTQREHASERLEACAEILIAAGYSVEPQVNSEGLTRSLNINRWED